MPCHASVDCLYNCGQLTQAGPWSQVRYWHSGADSWQEWRLSWQLGARIRLLRALLWCKSVKDYLEACWFALYHSGDVIAAAKP